MTFSGKRVLVTGASVNTGLGIARRFAAEGALVFVSDLDPAQTAQAVQQLQQSTSERVFGVAGDLADQSAIDRMFAQVQETAGGLDILVNNAAQHAIGFPFLETPLEVLMNTLRVNLVGSFLCGQRAARMMQTNGGGSIINVGSNCADRAIRERSAYIASKGAVEALTRAMAIELGPYGIRVNTVAPGYINTDRWLHLGPGVAARRRSTVPTGRESTAEDVANAVLFLASDAARQVTGTRLTIDGGCSIQLLPLDAET